MRFPTKFNKQVRNHQKKVQQAIFIPKITNAFDFSNQKSKKKLVIFFSYFLHWITHTQGTFFETLKPEKKKLILTVSEMNVWADNILNMLQLWCPSALLQTEAIYYPPISLNLFLTSITNNNGPQRFITLGHVKRYGL